VARRNAAGFETFMPALFIAGTLCLMAAGLILSLSRPPSSCSARLALTER